MRQYLKIQHMSYLISLQREMIIRKICWQIIKEIDWLTCPDKPSSCVPPIDNVAYGGYCYYYDKWLKQVYYYSCKYHKDRDNHPVKRS